MNVNVRRGLKTNPINVMNVLPPNIRMKLARFLANNVLLTKYQEITMFVTFARVVPVMIIAHVRHVQTAGRETSRPPSRTTARVKNASRGDIRQTIAALIV